MKDSQKFLSVVLGTGLMVLCCAAPIALVLFGTAGLAALAGYLDYLLFAALAIGLPLYARYHKRKPWRSCPACSRWRYPILRGRHR